MTGILAVVLAALIVIGAAVVRGRAVRRSRWAAVAVEVEAERISAEESAPVATSYWPDIVSHRHSFIRPVGAGDDQRCGERGT